MKAFQTNAWSISLPDEWDEEHDDEGVTLFNPVGCGQLEISTIVRDEPVDDGFLEFMAAEHLEAGAEPDECEYGDFEGLEFSYDDEGNAWREWYLCAENIMLYVTYQCPVADEGREDDEVDAILESLALA